MTHDNNEPPNQPPGVPHRDGQHPRPEGRRNIQSRPEPDASPSPEELTKRNPFEGIDPSELRNNPILLAQISAHLQENHLHLPLLTPDLGQMERMRKGTPELYEAYVGAIQSQIKSDEIARTAPYTEPPKVVRRGQLFGLIAVIATLLFCALLVIRDHVITAGIIAALDLVALASVFANGKDTGSKERE